MKIGGNTVLISGGATGIGLAMAEAFIRGGSEVIVCARTEKNLREARKKLPSLHIRRCNIADENERQDLRDWAVSSFPDLNILVNNAGIQRMIDFRKGTKDITEFRAEDGEDEIDVNLKALVYMTALFTPHLLERQEAAVVNVSSGLAFHPIAAMPVYCATKAAVHSFTLALREQLADTTVRVFEIIPPMVDTNLDKGARKLRGQTYFGMSVADFTGPAMEAFSRYEYEIRVQDPRLPTQWRHRGRDQGKDS